MNYKHIFTFILVIMLCSITKTMVAQDAPEPHAIATGQGISTMNGPQRTYELDGSLSYDTNGGTIIVYEWNVVNVQTTAPNPPPNFPFYYDTGSGGETTIATFTNPWIDEDVVYTVDLVVISEKEGPFHPIFASDYFEFIIDGTCSGPGCRSYQENH